MDHVNWAGTGSAYLNDANSDNCPGGTHPTKLLQQIPPTTPHMVDIDLITTPVSKLVIHFSLAYQYYIGKILSSDVQQLPLYQYQRKKIWKDVLHGQVFTLT